MSLYKFMVLTKHFERLKKGNDIYFIITALDLNGVLDVTSSTSFITIKPNLNEDGTDTTAIIKVAGTIEDATGGILSFKLTDANTEVPVVGTTYWYDIVVKLNNNDVHSLLEGNISFSESVTQVI